MTELIIEDKYRVDLNDKFSVKLTEENTYFTKSSKYTYDIEIPLKGNANNQKIFGFLNRIDVTKTTDTMKARIVADNRTIINGTAIITESSADNIKIQIVSGTAELNFISKNENVYIDELTLGYITKADGTAFATDTELINYANALSDTDRMKFLFGLYGDTNAVFYTVYKPSTGGYYNNLIRKSKDGEAAETCSFLGLATIITGAIFDESFGDYKDPEGTIVAQPYLCYIIRRIMEVLGYTMIQNVIENTVLKNVFIANGEHITDFGQCLPHWTVSDFLTYMENFLGVTFIFDDVAKTVNILSRDSFFDALNVEQITTYEDEYSVSTDKDETKDITDSNIKYSFNAKDNWLQLDDEIMQNVEVKKFDNYKILTSYWQELSDTEKQNYIYETGGVQYINIVEQITDTTTQNSLKEVNNYRNLVRNSSDNSSVLELKVVPVEMVKGKTTIVDGKSTKVGKYTWGAEFPVIPVMNPSTYTYVEQLQSVQKMIEGETSDTGDKQLTMEVAMNDAQLMYIMTAQSIQTSYPYPFVLTNDLGKGELNRGFSFELNKVDGKTTMYDIVFGKLNKVETKSEYCIKFTTKEMPDVSKRFIIANKAFMCEKIEYKIDAKGISDEKTGYFYEAKL